jgi:hypothetical protein
MLQLLYPTTADWFAPIFEDMNNPSASMQIDCHVQITPKHERVFRGSEEYYICL